MTKQSKEIKDDLILAQNKIHKQDHDEPNHRN